MTAGGRGWAARTLGATLFFLAWALLFVHPLLLHASDSVILSSGGDVYLHLWDLWWVDHSLIELGTNPFHTTFLYHPTGVSLYYHSLNLLNGLAAIPLQRVLGLTGAFNLLLIANLTLDGLVAYWLCRERSGSTAAALVGGALFAAAPLMGTSVNLGQLDEVTAWWIPLYLLALLRALDSPGAPWTRGGGRRATLAAGVSLAGASLATWYFTAGLVTLTLVFVPVYLFLNRSERRIGPLLMEAAAKVGAALGIMALLLSPLLWAMVRERLSGATYMLPSYDTTLHNSADLAAIFLPARTELAALSPHGSNVALGYVALGLAVAALVVARRRALPALAGALVLALLALGPSLQVGGTDTQLPLPYSLLNNVPFIGASRQPLRFLATAAICLSLAATFALAALESRFGRARGSRYALAAVALALAALELFGLPRRLISSGVGPSYSFIRDSPQQGAVMELPYELWQARPGLNQSVHERPILGGYTSRHFPYPFIEGAPGASQLAVGYPESLSESDIFTPTLAQTALASLDYYGVRYVLLHKPDLASGRFGRLVSLLRELYPQGPAYEDPEALLYVTPVGPARTLSPALPLVGLGKGWHELEENPVRRWTGSDPGNGNAQVWVGIRPEAVGDYSLRLNAFSYGRPRHLTVLLNGRGVFEKEVGLAPEELEISLGRLDAGDYVVDLTVREVPESPPGDRRLLSIGYTRVSVERAGR